MFYTYLIGWSDLNKFYYGVRYSKKAHLNELWKTYFTSSKVVKRFRKKYGEPDIIQVRKTFDSSEKAMLWENKVLKRMNCSYSDVWLNQTDNISIHYHGNYSDTSIGREAAYEVTRGKTYEEIFGEERGRELRKIRSDHFKKLWNSEEYKHIIKGNKSKKLNRKCLILLSKDLKILNKERNNQTWLKKVGKLVEKTFL